MLNKDSISIIGAGISGLACAAKLKRAGFNPVVFDKGRGIGGRMATRRTDTGLQFDHGAQHIKAKTPEFQAVLDSALRSGMIAKWDFGYDSRYVGVPGMNGLAKFLAQGIDVRQGTHITAIEETETGCELTIDAETHSVSTLVVTVPAPQAGGLLGVDHPLAKDLAKVEIEPCLTLMVALHEEARPGFLAKRDTNNPISWIALDSSKPGRETENCWVAQASPDWSKQHLEEDPSAIAELMLPLVCDQLGVTSSNIRHAVAHRWRYAAVSKPLGKPFLKNDANTLYLGGDWCLDARVEAAWSSGDKIATDILCSA